jgi:hypothetical protein
VNFEHPLDRVDAWRRRSPVLGIPVAVIKEFLDDGADALVGRSRLKRQGSLLPRHG